MFGCLLLNFRDIKGLRLCQAENVKLFGSIGFAEEDVRSRTEHDFRHAAAFAGPTLDLPTLAGQPDPSLALQHLGFPEKLRGFTAAYPCTVLGIADRCAMGPTSDRGGAVPE